MITESLSPFIKRCLKQQPQLKLGERENLLNFSAEQYLEWLGSDEDFQLTETFWIKRTKRRKQQLFAKLAYAEINGFFDVKHSGLQLSRFADACLLHAHRYYHHQLTQKYGLPMNKSLDQTSSICFIAMGKWGGEELNFSSDIDVIIAYQTDGETQTKDNQRRISTQEYYQRLSKQIILALSEVTEDGFVYRIDTRIRPFGIAGAQAISLSFVQNYLQNHARDWERLAYAKARPISPNLEAETQFEQIITAYVYRQYTDYGLLASIRHIRDQIATKVHNKQLYNNIKVGKGGIRSIEFSVQTIQFMFYAKFPDLRCRGTFRLLEKLKAKQLIPLTDATQFMNNLIFLRSFENRLQMWNEEQTHELPTDKDKNQWQWLVSTMHFSSIDQLKEKIQQVREENAKQFQSILPDIPVSASLYMDWNDTDESAIQIACLELIKGLQPPITENPVVFLGNFSHCLSALIRSKKWQLASQSAQKRFQKLIFEIIKSAGTREHLIDGHNNWELLFSLFSSILLRSAYISLLIEYRQVLARIVDWSFDEPWLIKQIIKHPFLLDSIVDSSQWLQDVKRPMLKQQWHNMRHYHKDHDLEKKIHHLREFTKQAIFKVAALYQNQNINTYHLSDYLSNIARQSIQSGLQIAIEDLKTTWQKKLDLNWDDLPFLIVGYGKLGSFELGFGSDLDVVMLYDDEGTDQKALLPFFIRLGRKWIDVMSINTVSGICYEIDCRLRPDGNKNLLVSGIKQFEQYHKNRAWTWEKQALIKARNMAGNLRLGRKFQLIRKNALNTPIDQQQLLTDMQSMQLKMRKNLDRSDQTWFDLKHGEGGMVDIEFLTQYFGLTLFPDHPNLICSRSVSALLSKMDKKGISPLKTKPLINSYLELRIKLIECTLHEKPDLLPRSEVEAIVQTVIEQKRRWLPSGS